MSPLVELLSRVLGSNLWADRLCHLQTVGPLPREFWGRRRMSALGRKQTFRTAMGMSACPRKRTCAVH
jgi:hypothetical protein